MAESCRRRYREEKKEPTRGVVKVGATTLLVYLKSQKQISGITEPII